MNSTLRDSYLDAMGIHRWVSRDACADVDTRHDAGADAGAGMLDWPVLEQRVSGCGLCGLQAFRSNTVFGSGSRNADWMIVGEAPGAAEELQGEPFAGPAGQLLTEMLTAIGLQREGVYICNILKCRTPDDRDPSAEEVNHCSVYLHRQVELIRPLLILAVGGIAANSLLGVNEEVGKLRGRMHSFGPQNIPLVVTHHPAYLLSSPQEKRKTWDDLLFARSVITAGHGG